MELKELEKLAAKKANGHEVKGSDAWFGLYHGFIYGWQACEKNSQCCPICNSKYIASRGRIDHKCSECEHTWST